MAYFNVTCGALVIVRVMDAVAGVAADILDDLIHFRLPPNVFAAHAAESILPGSKPDY